MFSPTLQEYYVTRRTRQWQMVTAVLILALVILFAFALPMAIPGGSDALKMDPIELPLAFVPNAGQTAAEVHFQAADMGGTLYFAEHEVVLSLPGSDQAPVIARLQFEGANPAVSVSGQAELPGKVNYILGSDPAGWMTDIPTYQGVLYKELYPGIDLSYDGTNGRLKGTYTVAPGADPGLIRWHHEGAAAVSLDNTNNLRIALPGSAETLLIEEAPVAWQTIGGQQQMVDVRYALGANGVIGFAVGSYNSAYPLIVDPTLIYSTTLGGSSFENAEGIALDSAGNVYITGVTNSVDFPTAGAYEGNEAYSDIFVAKIDATGESLVYSTYIGGNGDDEGSRIAVDANGYAYITGSSDSTNFPVVNALQANSGGLDDALIVKLNPAGNSLALSTYLGGSSVEGGEGIALDAAGNIYVTGFTASANFPTAAAWDKTLGGAMDAFVTKMNSSGTAWLYSTYLGGSDVDTGADIALDDAGNAFVVGNTFSTNFPTANAYQANYRGKGDLFVTRLNAAGSSPIYSTYLGGTQTDYGYGLDVTNGLATITGQTESTDFPLQTAVQGAFGGGTSDALLVQLSANGQSLLFSTYLGGSGEDKGYDVITDSSGSIYVTGDTFSTNFPTAVPLQANLGGTADAFLAKFNNQGLSYSTYLGGSQSDHGYGLTTDGAGNIFIVGVTMSANFPAGSPLANSPGGETDIFVVKIYDEGNDSLPPVAGSNLAGSAKEASMVQLGPDEELTFTIRLINSGTDDATVAVRDTLPDELTYVANSASGSGAYSAGTHTVSWENIPVGSGAEVLLTFAVTADVQTPVVVVNTAVITPEGEESLERSTAVLLTPETVVDKDIVPPLTTKVTIGSQDLLVARETMLHITATDNVAPVEMHITEWQLATSPFPYWQKVQSSGWIPYQSSLPWILGEASGTHFVAVWVADAAGNVSPLSLQALDYASLVLAGETVAQHDAIAYLVHYEAGAAVTAMLSPTTGDADLYLWYPGNFATPDQKSTNAGTAVDMISFNAPETGPYLFLVYGYTSATFDLSITPAGGVSKPAGSTVMTSPASVSAKDNELTAEPLLTVSGLNPLGTAATPEGPFKIYLPILALSRP